MENNQCSSCGWKNSCVLNTWHVSGAYVVVGICLPNYICLVKLVNFFLAKSLSGLACWRLQDLESVWVLVALGDQRQLDF